MGEPHKEQRLSALEWAALIFMVCCIIALVVVYLVTDH